LSFRNDLAGKTFGSLKVLAYNYNTKKWVCQCTCKNIIEVETVLLTTGRKKSCGCQKYIRNKNSNGNTTKLQKIYNDIVYRKGGDWQDWDDFEKWAINNGYNEQLSYRKKTRGKAYSKENLEFGIKFGTKFLPIKEAKKNNIYYNRKEKSFTIRFKYNNVMVEKTNIGTISELCIQHIILYHRYFHKKSFFE